MINSNIKLFYCQSVNFTCNIELIDYHYMRICSINLIKFILK